MMGNSLRELYYKDSKNHENEYRLRYNAPYAKHFDINIQQLNRNHSFPAFFQYNEEIASLIWNISKESNSMRDVYKKTSKLFLEQLLMECYIAEIQATNDIEGVHSTRREIKEAYIDIANGGKAKRFDSVIKKYMSIASDAFSILEDSKDIRELYDFFVLDEVEMENPNEVPDGLCFRKDSVSVYSPTNKEIHRGVNPETEIIRYMDYALDLLNNSSIPKIIAIAIFHYLFGYIHPFYNGNGRTARYIATLYLAQEIDPLCSLRLSISIKARRNKYYKMFEYTTDENARGELTYFIIGFLEIILSTIRDTRMLIEKKFTKLEIYRKRLSEILEENQIYDKTTIKIYNVLLEAVLFGGLGLTIEEIKNQVGVSRNTVDGRLANIPKEHYIKDISSKTYRYRLNSLIFK